MKYLKYFENDIRNPQIGDYVLCDDVDAQGGIREFISNNIGKYIRPTNDDDLCDLRYKYMIQYDSPPNNLGGFTSSKSQNDCRGMSRGEIIYFSPNKQELETILAAKKYNL